MSDSPTVATLQSLLKSPEGGPNKTPSSSSSSSSISPSLDSSIPSATSSLPGSTSTSYWTSTLTSAFGYGRGGTFQQEHQQNGAGAVNNKGKGKARNALPQWDELAETKDESSESSKEEVARGDQVQDERVSDELDQLVESILYSVPPRRRSSPSTESSPDSTILSETLLVLASSRIPESTPELSHQRLLERLRYRLERFSEENGPYSIILLVNPTPYPPTTPRLVSSYLALSRSTRKNLQKLWVVGGGWWTRIILTLFNTTLISLKTQKRRKIVQCWNLSELAKEMGSERFRWVEFPLEVYIENSKVEKEIELPEGNSKEGPFGVYLETLCGQDGLVLPPILKDCLDVLGNQGPSSLGIFRRSPSAATVKVLELAYTRGHPVSLSSYPDAPYLAASLLKLFLRELKDPILSDRIIDMAKQCSIDNEDEAIRFIREELIPSLESSKRNVLTKVVKVLHRISLESKTNLMNPSNLVICLCPALIGGVGGLGAGGGGMIEACSVPGMGTMRGVPKTAMGSEKEGNTIGGVLKIMIEHYDKVFEPPSTSSTTPTTISPPSSSHSEASLSTTTTSLAPTSPVRERTIRTAPPSIAQSQRTDVRGIFGNSSSLEEAEEEEEVESV